MYRPRLFILGHLWARQTCQVARMKQAFNLLNKLNKRKSNTGRTKHQSHTFFGKIPTLLQVERPELHCSDSTSADKNPGAPIGVRMEENKNILPCQVWCMHRSEGNAVVLQFFIFKAQDISKQDLACVVLALNFSTFSCWYSQPFIYTPRCYWYCNLPPSLFFEHLESKKLWATEWES